jgi:2-hydroxy-6-oxonona-2,4-dienedioate hydrolase
MKALFQPADGRRMRVLAAGRPGDAAIVLVHGIGTLAERWVRNIEELAAVAPVLAPDLWNNGFSDDLRPGEQPPLAHMKQLVQLLDAQGVRRCVVVGSSYGGQIAALLALNHPDRVAGLVVVGSGTALHPPHEQAPVLHAVRANAIKAIEDGTADGLRARLRSTSFSDEGVVGEMVLPLLTANALPGRRESSLLFFDALIAAAGDPACLVQPRLEALRMPVLLITGRDDARARWQAAVEARERIPGSQVHVFERCGHGPMAEHPQLFNRLVSQFAAAALSGNPPSRKEPA